MGDNKKEGRMEGERFSTQNVYKTGISLTGGDKRTIFPPGYGGRETKNHRTRGL